jgi:hypothetical protein
MQSNPNEWWTVGHVEQEIVQDYVREYCTSDEGPDWPMVHLLVSLVFNKILLSAIGHFRLRVVEYKLYKLRPGRFIVRERLGGGWGWNFACIQLVCNFNFVIDPIQFKNKIPTVSPLIAESVAVLFN